MRGNKAKAKNIATEFYYWWHNQPGTNTEQGFEEWWETTAKERRPMNLMNMFAEFMEFPEVKNTALTDNGYHRFQAWKCEKRGCLTESTREEDGSTMPQAICRRCGAKTYHAIESVYSWNMPDEKYLSKAPACTPLTRMQKKTIGIGVMIPVILGLGYFIYGMYSLERTVHWSYSYEEQVQETVRAMVKPEALQEIYHDTD